eukprot:c25002_g1_i2 orf=98-823(+)
MERQEHWNRVVVPQVLLIVSGRLGHRDVCASMCVSSSCRRLLSSHAELWKVLDLHGANNAGERLHAALSLPQFELLVELNLEFAQGLEDYHLTCLQCKYLQRLNLNACQKITDNGVLTVASSCPKLQSFSIYWNLRVSDTAVEALVQNCKELTSLNLSGCKGITDKSLELIGSHCTSIKSLNLTRCLKLTDDGLLQLLEACRRIEELNLYAVSCFTERSYLKLCNLQELRLLDLCGAQVLV